MQSKRLSQVSPSPYSILNEVHSQQQATYLSLISCFLQIRPEAASEKVKVESEKSEYLALGIPAEWIEPLQKLGYTTIEKLKGVEKPGKLANDMNGYKKKNKLDLPGLSPEEVGKWIKN